MCSTVNATKSVSAVMGQQREARSDDIERGRVRENYPTLEILVQIEDALPDVMTELARTFLRSL
jgi:hypothetical protein